MVLGGAAWVCGSGSAARDRCWDKQGLDTAWGESRELGEFWAELGSFGKGWLGERLGRASGELGESFGRAWKEAGESFGRAWGDAGESFGRASGKLRESLGRASGKLRAGERLGKAFREVWGEPWQHALGEAVSHPWSMECDDIS